MNPLVSVVMGSRSDWATMEQCVGTLEQLGIPHDVRVLSAHRTPEALVEHIESAEVGGVEDFIAAAGGAAHLAGGIAARTARPVLGVPIESEALGGLDSLLSTVQILAWKPNPRCSRRAAEAPRGRASSSASEIGGAGRSTILPPTGKGSRRRVARLWSKRWMYRGSDTSPYSKIRMGGF